MAFLFSAIANTIGSAIDAAKSVGALTPQTIDFALTKGAQLLSSVGIISNGTAQGFIDSVQAGRSKISNTITSLLGMAKNSTVKSTDDTKKVVDGSSVNIPNNTAWTQMVLGMQNNLAKATSLSGGASVDTSTSANGQSSNQSALRCQAIVKSALVNLDRIDPTKLVAASGWTASESKAPWQITFNAIETSGNWSYNGWTYFADNGVPITADNGQALKQFNDPIYLKPDVYKWQMIVIPNEYKSNSDIDYRLQYLYSDGTYGIGSTTLDFNTMKNEVCIADVVGMDTNQSKTVVAITGVFQNSGSYSNTDKGWSFQFMGLVKTCLTPITNVSYNSVKFGRSTFCDATTTWGNIYGDIALDQSFDDPNFNVENLFHQTLAGGMEDMSNVILAWDQWEQNNIGQSWAVTVSSKLAATVTLHDLFPANWLRSPNPIMNSSKVKLLYQLVNNAYSAAASAAVVSDDIGAILATFLLGDST